MVDIQIDKSLKKSKFLNFSHSIDLSQNSIGGFDEVSIDLNGLMNPLNEALVLNLEVFVLNIKFFDFGFFKGGLI